MPGPKLLPRSPPVAPLTVEAQSAANAQPTADGTVVAFGASTNPEGEHSAPVSRTLSAPVDNLPGAAGLPGSVRQAPSLRFR